MQMVHLGYIIWNKKGKLHETWDSMTILTTETKKYFPSYYWSHASQCHIAISIEKSAFYFAFRYKYRCL